MRKTIVTILLFTMFWVSCNSPKSAKDSLKDLAEPHLNAIEKIPFQQVKITDNFWRPKIEVNRVSSIRHSLDEAAESIEFFDIAAGISNKEHKGNMASDSDVFKIIQGAAYALYHTPDKELEATIDSVIDRIVAAQQDDGYLFSYWIAHDLTKRWTDIERQHELYCAGHMFEAAAAYYEITGKRKFLDAAMRYADHIDSIFGPGKRVEVPGHQEIELALYKLYQVSGEKRYLDLSIFFIDERGNPERIAEALIPPEHDPRAGTPQRWRHPSYRQDHLPVTEQFYAVGHAVRAAYLYSSMVDITLENQDPKYIPALDSIWNDIVQKKLYITGGIGTRQFHDEGFGTEYLLPNDQAYCETCSSIGLTFWNRRMNLLHADGKYADLLELTMFNSGISGVSLEGNKFFYTNPLESDGRAIRRDWFNPPCCPTNMVRFLPEIGSIIYGTREDEIFVNQFIGSETTVMIAGNAIKLIQETEYPWEGKVSIKVEPESKAEFSLRIRIPGWARGKLLPNGLYDYINKEANNEGVLLKVNGKKIRNIKFDKGYAIITRNWEEGDLVVLELPMEVRLLKGDSRIQDTRGQVVIMRGPVVYCAEESDNQAYFNEPTQPLLQAGALKAEYRQDLLGGLVAITAPTDKENINVSAIPYYAWNNRGQGQMRVWLPFNDN